MKPLSFVSRVNIGWCHFRPEMNLHLIGELESPLKVGEFLPTLIKSAHGTLVKWKYNFEEEELKCDERADARLYRDAEGPSTLIIDNQQLLVFSRSVCPSVSEVQSNDPVFRGMD